ncbi:MAG: hypothetical protein WA151_21260 [Desulfatirhabdiaceae bacterium]
MDEAKKAALFNALLFPGWGQFYLKHYKRGLAFFVPVLIGMLALAWMVIQVSAAIIKAAPFKKGTVQLSHVVGVIVKALKAIDLSYFLLMMLLIAALWILSIVDAYQLGKRKIPATTTDADQESPSDPV